MPVQTIIELKNKLTKDENNKLIRFFEKELDIKNMKIFDADTYAQKSEFTKDIYNEVLEILKDDFKEY